MANYFNIYLDTTPPVLEIFMIDYTTLDSFVDIIIESNELLLNYQDIYIIDSLGNFHEVILNFEETRLTGKLVFNEFPIGIATLYCRLKDSMGNFSEVISKTINIYEKNYLLISVKEFSKKHILNFKIKARDLLKIKNSQNLLTIFSKKNIVVEKKKQNILKNPKEINIQ